MNRSAPTAISPLDQVSAIAETVVSLYRTNPLEQVRACLRWGTIVVRSGIFILALVATESGRRKKPRRKRRSLYTKSEKNQIIDSLLHPLSDQHWGFVIIDGVLHAFNENDPVESFVKFLKFNAPELLKRILKEIL